MIVNAERRLEQIRELERTLAILEGELASENAKDKPDLKRLSFLQTQLGKVLRNLERLRKVDRRVQAEKLKESEARDSWKAQRDRYNTMSEREKIEDFVRRLFRVCQDDADLPENAEKYQEMIQQELKRREAAQAEQARLDALPDDVRHVEDHRQEGPCGRDGCRGL